MESAPMIEQIIKDSTERRDKFNLRYKMYHDNYAKQVETKLGQIYRAFVELKLDVQLNKNFNIYKRVINEISGAYTQPPSRTFTNEDFVDLYKKSKVNKYMKRAEQYMQAFNDVLLQVDYDEENDKVKLIIRTPDKYVVEMEGDEIVAIAYISSVDGSKTRWAYWSDTEHYYLDETNGEVEKVSVEGNEGGVNPYGVMPFVVIQKGIRDYGFFDVTTGDDLTGGTVDAAVHLTFLNHLIKTQSFKQLIGKGDNLQQLEGQTLDPLTIMTLTGQNTDIDVLDLQSNYDQLWKTINDMAINLSVGYGVSPSQFSLSGDAQSGFALQLENLKRDSIVEETQDDFTYYEHDLFQLIKKMTEKDGDMDIDYPPISYPLSPNERLDSIAKGIDLALTSAQAELQKENPDMTDEEANAEVADNIAKRNVLLQKTAQPVINATATAAALGIEQ